MTASVQPIGSVPFSTNRASILIAVLYQRGPTVRSVADYAGVSVETAHRHLSRLRDLGLVEWEPGRSRTLRARVVLEPVV